LPCVARGLFFVRGLLVVASVRLLALLLVRASLLGLRLRLWLLLFSREIDEW
jgi:hypothetical protein